MSGSVGFAPVFYCCNIHQPHSASPTQFLQGGNRVSRQPTTSKFVDLQQLDAIILFNSRLGVCGLDLALRVRAGRPQQAECREKIRLRFDPARENPMIDPFHIPGKKRSPM